MAKLEAEMSIISREHLRIEREILSLRKRTHDLADKVFAGSFPKKRRKKRAR